MEYFFNEKELKEKLQNTKLICLDMDGTLTDGGMYLDENGIAIRRFYAHDGTGIQMVKALGIQIAIITTSISKIVHERAKMLGIENIVSGSNKKGDDLLTLCKNLKINPQDTIHMGDDINDIPAFQVVGLPIAVANCAEAILPFVKYKTTHRGGHGAIREICDLILLSRTGKLYGKPYLEEFKQ
ncbi:3-deoxy-D-manno-octulosonate 8-phosphate phosphatase KdsC [Candidatus Hepatincola sp. Pdp]